MSTIYSLYIQSNFNSQLSNVLSEKDVLDITTFAEYLGYSPL